MKFVLFPNGRVWRLHPDKTFAGIVEVKHFSLDVGYQALLDRISIAATGSDVVLTDATFELRGGNMVYFSGVADLGSFDEDDENAPRVLDLDSVELREALCRQYSLIEPEVSHLLDNLDNTYGPETVLPVAGSDRAIAIPSYPAECDYVRVLVDGFEVAYWVDSEWGEDPAAVMGALIGAARGCVAGG